MHGDLLRRLPHRRGRNARVLSVVVLAYVFAFTLWPCCDALASSLLQPGGPGLPQQHNDGAMHGHDGAPGPPPAPGWMQATSLSRSLRRSHGPRPVLRLPRYSASSRSR